MKSLLFFVLFFVNAVIGILFRLDVACIFSVISFVTGFVLLFEPSKEENEATIKSE